MPRDWSGRDAALKYFEKHKHLDDDGHYAEAINALRRSQDHTAIQTKLQRTINALRVYTNCRHGCVDCFCTKEARAELFDPVAQGETK